MPMIDDKNFDEYFDKEELFTQRKYGSAIYLPKGSAVYLPSGQGFGDFISNAAKFISDNKDVISSSVDTASKVAKLGIDISKGVEEVNNLKALRQRKKETTGGSLEDKLYPNYNLSLKQNNKREDEELAEEIANASGSGFQIINP
jgi:hypothetical protein